MAKEKVIEKTKDGKIIVKMIAHHNLSDVEYTAGQTYEVDEATYDLIKLQCIPQHKDYKHKMINGAENK